jgi:calcium channel MID1
VGMVFTPRSSARAVTRAVLATLILTTQLQPTCASSPPEPDAIDPQTQLDVVSPAYEPEFTLFGRDVIGRASVEDRLSLDNNAPVGSDLKPGEMICYKVEKNMLFGLDLPGTRHELRAVNPEDETTVDSSDAHIQRRQRASRLMYVSANTCRQPSSDTPDSAAPQLILSVSSGDDGCPDPSKNAAGMQTATFEEGAATLSTDVSTDVFVRITAPKVPNNFEGIYNFEVAISIDGYYHQYDNTSQSDLLIVAADSNNLRLRTREFSKNEDENKMMREQIFPYELIIFNRTSNAINGMQHSVCGLMNNKPEGSSKTSVSNKTGDEEGGLRQEFFVEELRASSNYMAILITPPQNSTWIRRQQGSGSGSGSVGGGGTVFKAMQFDTASSGKHPTQTLAHHG